MGLLMGQDARSFPFTVTVTIRRAMISHEYDPFKDRYRKGGMTRDRIYYLPGKSSYPE